MSGDGYFDSFEALRKCGRVAATLVLATGWTTGAKADFLDDLFGGGAQETRAAPGAPAAHASGRQSTGHVSFSIRANDARRASRDRNRAAARGDESGAGSKPQKTAFCEAGLSARANPDSADVRLHDSTLRSGDSVVTADGILVFRGRAACPHTAADFVALAQSKLPLAKRNALETLEHAMRSKRGALVLSSDSEARPQVVSQNNH